MTPQANQPMKMKSIVSTIAGLVCGILMVTILPDSMVFVAARPSGLSGDAGARYACPMMDFIGNRPGDCPVCGMQMARVDAGDLTREQSRRLGLETSVIPVGPAKAIIRAYGTVRYDERTSRAVIARVAGRIVQRHPAALHPGTRVKPGDPIIDLYSPEVFAAQAELAATIKLGDAGTRQAIVGKFARWNLAPVAAAILAGGDPVDTVTITSPFAGLVRGAGMEAAGDGLPRIGDEVMADRPLLGLVDPSSFMVALQVPENRAHWLRVGQNVVLATDESGELPEVVASVSWVAPEINPGIRTREVHLHLVDPDGKLLPGGLVNARIEVVLDARLAAADPREPSTWGAFPLVPKSAVLSTGVRHVAWKVVERTKDGRVRFALAPLALGPRLEDAGGKDHYVVRAGLAAGDEVATQGAFLIDSQAQLAGTTSLLFPAGATSTEVHQH